MKAVEISSINFQKYGILYDMKGEGFGNGLVNRSSGDGWSDANTAIPVIDTTGTLGYTIGSGTPFTTTQMERHLHTQEALFCAADPIIFLVAEATENDAPPKAEQVTPVLLRSGQIAVLHRGVWHSSAHGISSDAQYFYLALAYQNEPTVWRDIIGGPISVEG